MSKLSDYYNFELQASVYLNSAHADKSPRLKYKGEYIVGEWYGNYVLEGNTIVRIPRDSFLVYGRKFVNLLINNDVEFTDYLYSEYSKILTLSDMLEEMNMVDVKNNSFRDKNEFYDEYIKTFSSVIGFGYPLDMALEEYVNKSGLNTGSIKPVGESFILTEEKDLKRISKEKNEDTKKQLLTEHSFKYSYLLNNYSGYKPVPINYFTDRSEEISKKDFLDEKYELIKPQNISEWISFSTYIRDVRKKCNMIANGMLDRYLKSECQRLNLDYKDAIFLTPEEFDLNKNSSLPKFNGKRIVKATHEGLVDISLEKWDGLVSEVESNFGTIKGVVASRGLTKGTVRVILSSEEFNKMQNGDVIVTSMTRPEFAPILKMASAIVTNEGGITCHAAILSRELGIPCIIATVNATQVLKDGDMVEVDADKGVVRVIL